MICTVLLKEGKKSQEMHAELAGYLLQILTDHKCILNEMEAYRLFSRLIQSVHDNIGGENMVEILLKKSKMVKFVVRLAQFVNMNLTLCFTPPPPLHRPHSTTWSFRH